MFRTHPRSIGSKSDCIDIAGQRHGSYLVTHEELHTESRIQIDFAIVCPRTKEVTVLGKQHEYKPTVQSTIHLLLKVITTNIKKYLKYLIS